MIPPSGHPLCRRYNVLGGCSPCFQYTLGSLFHCSKMCFDENCNVTWMGDCCPYEPGDSLPCRFSWP
jgi:hypothetical protein